MKCCICKLDINTQQSRVWLSEGVAHRTCRDDREKSLTQADVEKIIDEPRFTKTMRRAKP